MIVLLFTVRTSINLCQPITSGRIVELNNKSIIVNHNFTNVLVSVNDVSKYALQDKVILYDVKPLEFSPHMFGFNLENWSKSRSICYKTSEQDTYNQKGTGLLNWISRGGFNTDPSFIIFSRSLLFQSNPDQELDLFISMGIVYSLIIKLIQLCFLKQSVNRYESIFVSIIFLYLSINLAMPLSLIRVWVFYLSSKYIKDRIIRFSINLILCGFINPFGLTQLAFVLPLMFQFTSIFMPLKSRFIQRSLVLITVLVAYNHSYSLLNILIYPFLYVIYRYLIIFSISLMFIPLFNSIYIYSINLVDTLYKISLNYGVIKGHISILFIFLSVVLYHITLQHKNIQLILMNVSVWLGIRFLSIPFFYTVSMINVGQGDSFLIQAPFNQSVILIDTGSPYQYRSLKTFLDAQGINKIDHLIVTHDDSDHSGNVASLHNDFIVNDLVQKGKDIDNKWFFMDYLEFNQTVTNDNDASLVYYTNIVNTRFLFLGDLSLQGEIELVNEYTNLKVDILKIGHHGSKSSTSDDLLKLTQPRIGLLSVGFNNYGHPSYEVVERLEDYYIDFFNSNIDGDIKIIILPHIRFIINSKNELYLLL